MHQQKSDHPPPYGFQQPPPQNRPIIMQANEPIVTFGPSSQSCVCPHCHERILSTPKSEATTKTHVIALVLFCFICWPCVCLPYCMDSCQATNHYCPNCGSYLGQYRN